MAKFMAFANSHKWDNKVKVVEESPSRLNDCEKNYFAFPVSYHEDAQAFTKILEGPKNGDLKSGDKRGARLREAIIEDMSHESSSGRSFDQESTCSENSNGSRINYQKFIDFLQQCLKDRKEKIMRLNEENLQLRTQVSHLDEEVTLVKVNEFRLGK